MTQTIKLSDALNNPVNTDKTVRFGAEKPVQFTTEVWERESFSFTQSRRGANLKPDFDETNVGLLFEPNKAADKIYMLAQFSYARKKGVPVRPHIRWRQSSSNVPVWKLDYKWITNGQEIPANFTTITQTEQKFTYTSGSIAQVSLFPEIVPPVNDCLTCMLLMKLYRDDSTTALATVLGYKMNIAYVRDDAGAKGEFLK